MRNSRMAARAAMAAAIALLALGGCKARVDDRNGNAAFSASIGDTGADSTGNGAVTVNAPGVNLQVKLPNIDLGTGHLDIDGMKLYPASSVTGVNVIGDADEKDGGSGGGQVKIAFASADAPAKLVDYYVTQSRDHGFTTDAPLAGGGETRLHGTKAEDGKTKSFDLTVRPQGAGSTGAIMVTGD